MEEMKLVVEMLNQLGESAKTGFIWWLVISKGLYYLLMLIGFILVPKIIVSGIIRIVSLSSVDSNALNGALIRSWRDALGTGCEGFLTEDETRKTLDKINELVRQKRQERK